MYPFALDWLLFSEGKHRSQIKKKSFISKRKKGDSDNRVDQMFFGVEGGNFEFDTEIPVIVAAEINEPTNGSKAFNKAFG